MLRRGGIKGGMERGTYVSGGRGHTRHAEREKLFLLLSSSIDALLRNVIILV